MPSAEGAAADAPPLTVPGKPASLKALRAEASRLHQLVEQERQLLFLLEEQEVDAESRTRAAFDTIDSNGDGVLQYEEFEAAAAALLNTAVSQDTTVRDELRSRFNAARGLFDEADANKDGALDYGEFCALMASLRRDKIAARTFAEGLKVRRARRLAARSSPLHPAPGRRPPHAAPRAGRVACVPSSPSPPPPSPHESQLSSSALVAMCDPDTFGRRARSGPSGPRAGVRRAASLAGVLPAQARGAARRGSLRP